MPQLPVAFFDGMNLLKYKFVIYWIDTKFQVQ